jgi:hypothetical protein
MTVSVDVMVINGNTATTLTRDTNIFYDTEVLAIIHRSKSKSSGLVATAVYAWWGKRRQVNEREQRKLQDLAKRYGTALVSLKAIINKRRCGDSEYLDVQQTVLQCSEPTELIHLLGGQLAIRQVSLLSPVPSILSLPFLRVPVLIGALKILRCISFANLMV